MYAARDVDGPGNASGHLLFGRDQHHRASGNSLVGCHGMRTFFVRNSDDDQRLRIYLFLFAEYDGEAEDGWSRYRCAPEHEKAFEEYTKRQEVRWG
jgi:hypothetical protein